MQPNVPSFQQFIGNALSPIPPAAVDVMESMTPADIAQSVPWIRIWEIGRDGKPKHPDRPMSFQFAEPPAFGASSDGAFMERPKVSLQRMSVKTNLSRGTQNYKEIELGIVVHRPDAVFLEGEDRDNWTSLITPGSIHILEYGWQGSSTNPLINGQGFEDAESGVVVQSRQSILFSVATYSFGIQTGMEFEINIKGYEAGEHMLRNTKLGSTDFFTAVSKSDKDLDKDIRARVQSVMETIPTVVVPKAGKMVKLKDVLDQLVAPVLLETLRNMGYEEVTLLLGDFNSKVGKSAPNYGDRDMSGLSIGELLIRKDHISQVLSRSLINASAMTVMSFISLILSDINNAAAWTVATRRGANESKTAEGKARNERFGQLPELRTKTLTFRRRSKSAINLYIFDTKSDLLKKFDPDDRFQDAEPSRSAVIKKLRDKNIPVISFLKGLSFIRDASFSVEQDPRMQAILIQRSYYQVRELYTNRNSTQTDENLPNPKHLIYSSAISGDITMHGNFVFQLFGTLWLDFGVRQWSGPFYVMENEDVLENGAFVSKISVRSAGDDPLNSQGRLSDEQIKRLTASQKAGR